MPRKTTTPRKRLPAFISGRDRTAQAHGLTPAAGAHAASSRPEVVRLRLGA